MSQPQGIGVAPKPWSHWTFWQYTDSPLDEDRFNGTEAELLSYTGMPRSR